MAVCFLYSYLIFLGIAMVAGISMGLWNIATNKKRGGKRNWYIKYLKES